MITLAIICLLVILIGIPIVLAGIGVILVPTIIIGKELLIMLIAGIILFCIAKRNKML